MILAHDDRGAGPPVLLLHSGVADRRMWSDVAPALAAAHRVVAPDLRGFGDSPLPGEQFTDAADLVALLDDLGVDRAAVVGSSFGGRVALELATSHPGRVSALVLLCPALGGVPPTAAVRAFGEEEDRLLEAGDVEGAVRLNVDTWLGPEASPGTRDRVTAMQRRAFDVQLAAEAAMPEPERDEVEVDLATLDVPTVVVTGDHDLDHFGAIGRLLAERVARAELVTLPWAGHLPTLERPDEMTPWLLEVLARMP